MKYLIETYGCQMNKAESNSIELLLIGRGLERTENPYEADAVILNTCSVRKSAENRIWGRLGYYSKIKKERKFLLILTGCMADRVKNELISEAPFIDLVIGNNDKASIASFISGEEYGRKLSYSFFSSSYKEGDFSSYVPIMNGCDNFCSYCIVPYVRGREVSRCAEDIIGEIDYLDSKNVREVTLLGQNVNSYNYMGIDFASLLHMIVPHLNSIKYLRFESPHPKDFSLRLMEEIQSCEKIAKHIHLPMQSGSTRILSLMNRKNTREDFIALINKLRDMIPGVTFSTDVMVGFPTETEEDYADTLSLMEEMGCTEAFMYYYNPREGTRAFKMEGQIDEKVKVERLRILINEQLERQRKIKTSMLPFDTEAIVVGGSRDGSVLARNEHNDYFAFTPCFEHVPGDIVDIRASELSGNTFKGCEYV